MNQMLIEYGVNAVIGIIGFFMVRTLNRVEKDNEEAKKEAKKDREEAHAREEARHREITQTLEGMSSKLQAAVTSIATLSQSHKDQKDRIQEMIATDSRLFEDIKMLRKEFHEEVKRLNHEDNKMRERIHDMINKEITSLKLDYERLKRGHND